MPGSFRAMRFRRGGTRLRGKSGKFILNSLAEWANRSDVVPKGVAHRRYHASERIPRVLQLSTGFDPKNTACYVGPHGMCSSKAREVTPHNPSRKQTLVPARKVSESGKTIIAEKNVAMKRLKGDRAKYVSDYLLEFTFPRSFWSRFAGSYFAVL